MTRILLALALVLLVAAPAFAWTETYTWTADPSATSYKVEKSLDQGATWTSVGTPATPSFSYTGTDTGVVLFRVSQLQRDRMHHALLERLLAQRGVAACWTTGWFDDAMTAPCGRDGNSCRARADCCSRNLPSPPSGLRIGAGAIVTWRLRSKP